MQSMFNGMFGKVGSGMCRLSMNGEIAVKTSTGYKTYNVAKNRLTNCNNFVFDIGEEFFFVIPTNKVQKGDIIIVSGKPKCVVSSDKNSITVINYEDATIENILPERHVFMGSTYFYGKIVSMFGNNFMKGKKGMDRMMSYMLMSEMLKGGGIGSFGNNSGGSNMMLPLLMMNDGGNFSNMFEGMFDFDDSDFESEEIEEDIDNENEESEEN